MDTVDSIIQFPDIVLEIFKYVPPEYYPFAKRVCKMWNTVIPGQSISVPRGINQLLHDRPDIKLTITDLDPNITHMCMKKKYMNLFFYYPANPIATNVCELMVIHNIDSDTISRAIKKGYAQGRLLLASIIRNRPDLIPFLNGLCLIKFDITAIIYAVRYDRPEFLEQLLRIPRTADNEHEIHTRNLWNFVKNAVVSNGSVDCIPVLQKYVGIQFNMQEITFLLLVPQLKSVKYAVEHGASINDIRYIPVVSYMKNGTDAQIIEIIKYLIEKGLQTVTVFLRAAIHFNRIECIRYCLDSGRATITLDIVLSAISDPVIRLLADYEMSPFDRSWLMKQAIIYGTIDTITFLTSKSCIIIPDHLLTAVELKDTEKIRCTATLLAERTTTIGNNCLLIKFGDRIDFVELILECGIRPTQWLVQCTVSDDSINCLKFLAETVKCPFNMNTVLDIAISECSTKCVTYLCEQGCEFSPSNLRRSLRFRRADRKAESVEIVRTLLRYGCPTHGVMLPVSQLKFSKEYRRLFVHAHKKGVQWKNCICKDANFDMCINSVMVKNTIIPKKRR